MPASYTSPLSEQERRAVATLLRDGTYRQLADAAGAVDPDIVSELSSTTTERLVAKSPRWSSRAQRWPSHAQSR
jgi:hypothetical protein